MKRAVKGSLIGAAGAGLIVLLLAPSKEHLNSTTIALILLLLNLLIAINYGSSPAFITSILSVLCFNFFFLPPYHTFRLADPQNWIALTAFLATSLIAGGLSVREKRRAEEAEAGRKEIERLYGELHEAFQKASEAEALKQSEQLKSALLDAVTHDLRTPLTSMKAAVTTLLVDSPNAQTSARLDEEGRREMLEVIDSEIDRLNHLLEGMIEIARIEAGSKEPRRMWSNLDEIVSAALTRAAGITQHHEVQVVLGKDLPPVRVDERAMTEVLYVLIENATKYSPSGKEIMISVAKMDDQNALKVSVEDEGAGIPVELRERVFEKFFRFPVSDSSSKHRPAGLGMGLAIARALVQAHGGRIWIEDAASRRGTRVVFTIPLSQQEVAAVEGA